MRSKLTPTTHFVAADAAATEKRHSTAPKPEVLVRFKPGVSLSEIKTDRCPQ